MTSHRPTVESDYDRRARQTYGTLGLLAGVAGAAVLAHQIARVRRRLDWRDKVVLITGGSRGLGLVLARQLLRRGAKVAICSRAIPTLRRAEADLLAISPHVLAVPADVTRPYDIELLMAAVRERFGHVDVLVNNVGMIQVGPAQLMTEEDYKGALDTIFWSALRATEAVLPEMRKRGRGSIVNITSVGGLIPAPHLAPYVAAKHALLGYSRAMHNELARDGIRVTTVVPGLMRTGSPRNVSVKGNAAAEYAWFKIADSLPFTSINADRAAAKIVNAAEHGDAELQITLSAKLGVRVQNVFPNFSAGFAQLLNRVLPRSVGTPADVRTGRDAESAATRSGLTALTDRSARDNNQLVEEHRAEDATRASPPQPLPDPPRGHRPPGVDMPSVTG